MSSYLRPRRGKKSTAIAQLTSSNPLKRGEIFFEVPDDGVGTGAGKIKMGDGVTTYADLPYFSEGGSGDVGTVLTQAEYDALTPEQKANGTYWISDASGGSVVIDNALDATSLNAIANKPVAEAITQLNNDLTANNNKFQATYQNNKYGFEIDGTFYEIGGSGMPFLNYSSPLKILTSSGSWTATSDCFLTGTISKDAVLSIDSQQIISLVDSVSISIQGSPSYLAWATKTTTIPIGIYPVKSGQIVSLNGSGRIIICSAL